MTPDKGPHKIAIMGSGNIGMHLFTMLQRQYPNTEFVVYNRESEKGVGAAISGDQQEGLMRKLRRSPQRESHFTFTTNEEEALRDADIVVVTVGKKRRFDGQPRIDLAKDNIEAIDRIAVKAGELNKTRATKANYIIATNPIGLLDHHFQQVSGIPHDQIVGLSGELDVERLRQSMRTHLRVGYDDIRGERIVGDHGPNMVPVFSQIEIRRDGRWQKLLDLPDVHADDDRLLREFKTAAVGGGAKFVKWTGESDFRGPAAALAYMVEQVVDARWGDKDASLPVTASTFVPDAEVYSGQTVKFNADGTHSPAATPALSTDEAGALQHSLNQAKADKQKFNTLVAHSNMTGQLGGVMAAAG